MVAKSKLFTKLDSLEQELNDGLIPHLEQAASGNNDLIFCVKGYHSIQEFSSHSDPITEELVNIGAQILSLKKKLGEPSEGSTAERICWYCREWANQQKHHRKNSRGKNSRGKSPRGKSTQELARQFLEEMA